MASYLQQHSFRFFGKISLCDFSNPDFIVTEPKDVPYASTGVRCEYFGTEYQIFDKAAF